MGVKLRLRGPGKWQILLLIVLMGGCMKWDYALEEDFDLPPQGLFIVNEGNFQYGNSSLSFYVPETGEAINELFIRANGMKLGDVAQSMTIYGDKGWIAVNNSHVIFAIDLTTGKETGRIENLTSPRFIHFISDEKAYVTQLWDNRIFVVNPKTYRTTGYIEVPGMGPESGSTEEMVQVGDDVYCTCWSYQNTLVRIDARTDEVTGMLKLGFQPRWIVKDRYDMLWVLTDGGYEGSVYGYEPPALYRLDPKTFTVTDKFEFKLGDSPASLQTDASGQYLYWLNDDVWKMDVESQRLPPAPMIKTRETKYYSLTVSPYTGDVYVGDAIDYQQPGKVYRYSGEGELIEEFYVGITPGAFCWK